MSIADIIEEVEDALAELDVPATVERGKDVPSQEASPTTGRVVIVAGKPTWGPLNTNSPAGGNPRPVMTRTQELEIHVWSRAAEQDDPADQAGADEDATLQLADYVMLALWRVTYGSLRGGAGKWSNDAKTVTHGCELVFAVTVAVPVIDETWESVDDAEPDMSLVLQEQEYES